MASLLERLGGRRAPTDSLLANLRRLLAAHPGMAAAQPWLGIPVDPGLGPAGLERLRSAVADAIRRGEPRLVAVQVDAEPGEDGIARLVIRGQTAAGRLTLAVEPDGAVLRSEGGP